MLNQTLRETLDRPNFITNSDWRAFQAQPFKTSFQWMSDSIKIENLNWALAQDHRLEWSNLIGRALDSNVFLTPGFLLPAAQHIEQDYQPRFIFIWDHSISQADQQLLGLFVIDLPASGRGTIARFWQRNYSALGTPVVDKTRAEIVLDRFFKWIERHHPHIVAVQIPMLPAESNTALAFEAYSQHMGLEHKPLTRFQRAILSAGRSFDEVLPAASKAKHIRNWARQSRQLEQLGTVTYEIATTPHDVRQSIEDFMQLEASGWKGDQRTALIAKASLATFARTMARLLAHERQFAIHALKLNGKPISMGIVLISEDQACFWKIAYDEDFASYSPGIQFVLAFSKHQTAQADIALTDSCAIPNHPMIDRLWPERQNMVDLMIALTPRHNGAFNRAYARAIMVHSMREIAKKAYYRLMGRKVS